VSAGVRDLDGMSDGRSGSVRQWLRHVRSCSRGAAGVVMPTGHRPCSHGLAGTVACGSSGSGRVSGCAPHELPYLRWLPQGPPRARAGSRRTGGGRAPVQGVRPPQTPAWPLSPACPRVPDTGRPDGGSSASSGRLIPDRSGWLPPSSKQPLEGSARTGVRAWHAPGVVGRYRLVRGLCSAGGAAAASSR
jgi:hypothetical protein